MVASSNKKSKMEAKLDLRFAAHSRTVICAPSNSGKTVLLCKFLTDAALFERKLDKIFYFYEVFQKDVFENLQERSSCEICFINELDRLKEIISKTRAGDYENHRIGLVLDDLQIESMSSPFIGKLFTTYGHHLFEQTFFLMQNYFFQAKFSTTIMRNCTHIILLRSPRLKGVLPLINKSLFPGEKKKLENVYQFIENTPYAYLIINMIAEENNLFYTGICNGESMQIFRKCS